MSNTKKVPGPLGRGPQHQPARGRHREPSRTLGDLITRPRPVSLRALAAGAMGSAALGSAVLMPLAAGAGPAASAAIPATLTASVKAAPPLVSGGSVTGAVNNGVFGLSGTVNTRYGQIPLAAPTVTPAEPVQPVQLPFDKDAAIAAVVNDPAYQNLALNALYQSANQQVSQNLAQINNVGTYLSAAPSLPAAPASGGGTGFQQAAPVPLYDIPALPSPPTPGSVGFNVAYANGLGATLGGACNTDLSGCALTFGPLLGYGGSVRGTFSDAPVPTTLGANLTAQGSFNLGGVSGTAGVGTNFDGAQGFLRATSPLGFPLQATATESVPPSTLADMANAYLAAEAGMTVDQMLGAPTPADQVAQGFADLSNGGGLTLQPGFRAVSFGGQTTLGATMTIPFNLKSLADMGNAYSAAEAGMTVDQMLGAPTPPATLGNTADPLTYMPPGGDFPVIPAQVINSDFAQLNNGTAPGLFSQLALQGQLGQPAPGSPNDVVSTGFQDLAAPASITGVPSSALDQMLFLPGPAQPFPAVDAPGSATRGLTPGTSGQADPATTGTDTGTDTGTGTADATGLSGFPAGSVQVAGPLPPSVVASNPALADSFGVPFTPVQQTVDQSSPSGFSPQFQIQQQLVPDTRTPPVTDGIYPNLIPPPNGTLPGGTTIQMGNSTFTIPYDPTQPVVENVAPVRSGGVTLDPGGTNTYPPGSVLGLGTSQTNISGNRDTNLQLPDGSYYVGLPPQNGQPDTRTQINVSTVPPAGLDGTNPGTQPGTQTPPAAPTTPAPPASQPPSTPDTSPATPAPSAPQTSPAPQDSQTPQAPQSPQTNAAPTDGTPTDGTPATADASPAPAEPAPAAPTQAAPAPVTATPATVTSPVDPTSTDPSLLSPTPTSQQAAPLTPPTPAASVLSPAPTAPVVAAGSYGGGGSFGGGSGAS